MNIFDMGSKEDIVTNTVGMVRDIAVDWIYDLLYWIDSDFAHIVVSTLDGKLRKTLINSNIDDGSAIEIDSNSGLV